MNSPATSHIHVNSPVWFLFVTLFSACCCQQKSNSLLYFIGLRYTTTSLRLSCSLRCCVECYNSHYCTRSRAFSCRLCKITKPCGLAEVQKDAQEINMLMEASHVHKSALLLMHERAESTKY